MRCSYNSGIGGYNSTGIGGVSEDRRQSSCWHRVPWPQWNELDRGVIFIKAAS